MTGTVTGVATVTELCRQIVVKYGIQSGDALMLWEGIRERADSAEKAGFKEGFQMAQTILGLTESVEAPERPTDGLYSEGEYERLRDVETEPTRMLLSGWSRTGMVRDFISIRLPVGCLGVIRKPISL